MLICFSFSLRLELLIELLGQFSHATVIGSGVLLEVLKHSMFLRLFYNSRWVASGSLYSFNNFWPFFIIAREQFSNKFLLSLNLGAFIQRLMECEISEVLHGPASLWELFLVFVSSLLVMVPVLVRVDEWLFIFTRSRVVLLILHHLNGSGQLLHVLSLNSGVKTLLELFRG